MRNKMLTGAILGSFVLVLVGSQMTLGSETEFVPYVTCVSVWLGEQVVFGDEPEWLYLEDNMRNSYEGTWVPSGFGFQFYRPTQGWSEAPFDPEAEEGETQVFSFIPKDVDTEAVSGMEAVTESDDYDNDIDREMISEIVPEEDFPEDETESAIDIEQIIAAGSVEYDLVNEADQLTLKIIRLSNHDGTYPSTDMLLRRFNRCENVYPVMCNWISAVHFDAGDTENLVFAVLDENTKTGNDCPVIVISVGCSNRQTRELFADELFSSIQFDAVEEDLYLDDGVIWSHALDKASVSVAAESYMDLLANHMYASNEAEDTPVPASGFALVDMNQDGLCELVVRYDGFVEGLSGNVIDYALYRIRDTKAELLQVMEGLSVGDELFYFPESGILEYDRYADDGTDHYDCYRYDGDEVTCTDYYELRDELGDEWGVSVDEDEFIVPNTEENRAMITDQILE